MQRKRITFAIMMLLVFSFCSLSNFAATLSPALQVISSSLEVNTSCLRGGTISLSGEFFKSELSTTLLSSIKILSLPDESLGTLMLDGHPVCRGDAISPASLDKLTFVSDPVKCDRTSFSVGIESCGISYDIVCNIHVLDRLNFAPTCSESPSLEAFSGVSSYGTLMGHDPDGDDITFRIVSYTKKGSLCLVDSKKGQYVYTPSANAGGTDSFEYTVTDCMGNTSKVARVTISLDTISSEEVYSDMYLSPSAYSATVLSRLDIFTGERVNGLALFYPEKSVDLETFLMMAMEYSGIKPEKSSENPYFSTALKLGIIPSSMKDPSPAKVPSVAESATIIENLTKSFSSDDEYVFSPDINPELSYDRLVGTFPSLFHLENMPRSPLTRSGAASLVVNCLSKK